MIGLYSLRHICKNVSVGEPGSLKLKVLFFGATAEAAGTRSTVLEIPPGAASGNALKKVLELYPELASHKLLFSVNQTYARGDEPLNTGDELAVFTAVSGG
ncbi:MAG TPA: MoaD/ThiS family protein [Pyrinomonadaceae bacterium]